jgi:hypothetical protein
VRPEIRTFTGRLLDPTNPGIDSIDIRDIAHALALCNRFAGHTRFPISVAQHSVYVSRVARRMAQDGERDEADWVGLQGLLHDGSEAYLGDVTKWLKESPTMWAYREAEARAQLQIFQRFGCAAGEDWLVTRADRIMCRFEAERAMPPMDNWPDTYPPITREIRRLVGNWRPWGWRAAEEAFLAEFRLLCLALEREFDSATC